MTVSTKTTRKKAPPVEVDIWADQRKQLIEQLDKENPSFIHTYVSRTQTPDQLAREHKEIVIEEATGLPYENAGDPVARMPREVFDAQRGAMAQRSKESAGSIVQRQEDDSLYASPKKPRS